MVSSRIKVFQQLDGEILPYLTSASYSSPILPAFGSTFQVAWGGEGVSGFPLNLLTWRKSGSPKEVPEWGGTLGWVQDSILMLTDWIYFNISTTKRVWIWRAESLEHYCKVLLWPWRKKHVHAGSIRVQRAFSADLRVRLPSEQEEAVALCQKSVHVWHEPWVCTGLPVTAHYTNASLETWSPFFKKNGPCFADISQWRNFI